MVNLTRVLKPKTSNTTYCSPQLITLSYPVPTPTAERLQNPWKFKDTRGIERHWAGRTFKSPLLDSLSLAGHDVLLFLICLFFFYKLRLTIKKRKSYEKLEQ